MVPGSGVSAPIASRRYGTARTRYRISAGLAHRTPAPKHHHQPQPHSPGPNPPVGPGLRPRTRLARLGTQRTWHRGWHLFPPTPAAPGSPILALDTTTARLTSEAPAGPLTPLGDTKRLGRCGARP